MHIIELLAENYKKLTAVRIKPDGSLVQITGENDQGKTSVLDAIWSALENHPQAQPIRKGQKKGRIVLKLGEGGMVTMVVERRFTEKNVPGTITVENAEGLRFKSPQEALDSLIGSLCFDPLAFTRMKPDRQFEELRRMVKLEIDPDALDQANASDFSKRTDITRDAKAKRAQADAITFPEDTPANPIDAKALMDAIEAAGKLNADTEGRKLRRVSVGEEIDRLRGSAGNHRQQAEAEEARANELQKRLDDADPLPELIDVSELRAQVDNATLVNANIAKRVQHKRLASDAEGLENQAKALTEAMDARTKVKTDAIKAAKMPVPGLGFGEKVITFDDVPFSQASMSTKIKVSMTIAMAANPKLKVIRITDGSLLDEKSLAQVGEMAEANGFQVWLERVDTSGKIGFVIEDGHVKGQEIEEVSP